jgi:DNA-binding MarR family transcriptional regulator
MRIESFLKQSPIFQANRMARRMDASLAGLLEGEELSVFEAMVLVAIFFEKRGEIKPSELAVAFQTTRGNVSHCISSLEAKGLAVRRIDPEDARRVQLILKPLGRRRAVRVVGILDRIQRQLEETIGVATLESMLKQLGKVEALCAGLANARRDTRILSLLLPSLVGSTALFLTRI